MKQSTRSTRRGLLATLGIACTAGCTGLLSGGSGGDGTDNQFRGEMVKQVSETIQGKKGEHKAYSMEFTEQTVLIYSIVADKNVDVIVFRKDQYEKYKRNATDKLNYVSELSELNTKVTAKGSAVSAGKPVLVIDNTTWAETPPVSNVTVEVELEAFVRG